MGASGVAASGGYPRGIARNACVRGNAYLGDPGDLRRGGPCSDACALDRVPLWLNCKIFTKSFPTKNFVRDFFACVSTPLRSSGRYSQANSSISARAMVLSRFSVGHLAYTAPKNMWKFFTRSLGRGQKS